MSEHYDGDDAFEDDVRYGLLMPFVVCQSQDGPYDDAAFVAGASFTAHQQQLIAAPNTLKWAAYVFPEMVPQYDLLAMDNGFLMESEPWDEFPDEWVLVTFTKAGEVEKP